MGLDFPKIMGCHRNKPSPAGMWAVQTWLQWLIKQWCWIMRCRKNRLYESYGSCTKHPPMETPANILSTNMIVDSRCHQLFGLYSEISQLWAPSVALQCRRGQDRRVHHPQHRAGEDEVRGRGGHFPDGEDAAHPETGHRPDRGERAVPSSSLSLSHPPLPLLTTPPFSPPGPVPVLLPGQSGVPGKLRSLCNIKPSGRLHHATSRPGCASQKTCVFFF